VVMSRLTSSGASKIHATFRDFPVFELDAVILPCECGVVVWVRHMINP
jgi:hypothetical protein